MPYNFVADSFHTKKLCSRLSLSEVQFLMENGRFAFATYDVYLALQLASCLQTSTEPVA